MRSGDPIRSLFAALAVSFTVALPSLAQSPAAPPASVAPNAATSPAADGMPDLRVTAVQSTFVPSVADPNGGCTGPYLDLQFTIANLGADYPRPADLQLTLDRVQDPPETLRMLTLVYDLQQDGKSFGEYLVEVHRTSLATSFLPSGSTLDVHDRYRVPDDQRAIGVSAKVAGSYFMKTGNDGIAYETSLAIPIWDVSTVSASTIGGTGADGRPNVTTLLTVTNTGGSATPGPLAADVTVQYTEGGSGVATWHGLTSGPIAPGTTAQIIGQQVLDRALAPGFMVGSDLELLCPDGSPGGLSDGHRADNNRILHTPGARLWPAAAQGA
jgi:hypothetical protein